MALLKGSAHLRKIFYTLPVQVWEERGYVRITTIDESPNLKVCPQRIIHAMH